MSPHVAPSMNFASVLRKCEAFATGVWRIFQLFDRSRFSNGFRRRGRGRRTRLQDGLRTREARTHGLSRTWDASAANAHDDARFPMPVSSDSTAPGVGADTNTDRRRTRQSRARAHSKATSTSASRIVVRCPSTLRQCKTIRSPLHGRACLSKLYILCRF